MARVFRHTYTQKSKTGQRVTKTARKWYIEFRAVFSSFSGFSTARRRVSARASGLTGSVHLPSRLYLIEVEKQRHLFFDEYSEVPYGTSHDQPYDYDVHVPLLFYGNWVQPGKYHHAVDMADVTPTLCTILDISMPSGRDGRVIVEILRK